MKAQMTLDMERQTEAVEQVAKTLHEVSSWLNKTSHYQDVNWDVGRWTKACDELETAIAVFEATFND
jgi:hypothetical protein